MAHTKPILMIKIADAQFGEERIPFMLVKYPIRIFLMRMLHLKSVLSGYKKCVKH